MNRAVLSFVALVSLAGALPAAEIHVATSGADTNPGSRAAPVRTIQRAAEQARPGDTITVHEGAYRERINPPRGGESDARRIVYQAAPGEKVEIKGSEVVKNWTKVENDTWTVSLPNSMFGDFNPYSDLIRGDWFDSKGREHHTGAVYLNGEWLVEAATLESVLAPVGTAASAPASGEYLLNVAWLRPAGGERVAAASFAAKHGTQNAPCSEGGECVGFIQHGHWLRYEGVNLPAGIKELEIRAASASQGGRIEIRRDAPDGQLLGSCIVPHTGDWQSWATFRAKIKPTAGPQTLCLVFRGETLPPSAEGLWFARVDAEKTTLWAQFKDVDPNAQLVEINVRRTVFYPDKPGRNFITVRGFTLRHAATPWAPPTAEQIGLIGTHWSKGWVIENNVISHSICSGIALGKHGDEFDNTSANTAEGYVKTIERARACAIPWTKENIGHHIVRGNTISHCEQAGIVGSLGAAFSSVTDNTIHDVHIRRLFGGAEMSGIKFHAAIDTEIRRNHIYRSIQGLWLDWMAQGTRVSQNLFHDNLSQDLFVEVNHGPFLVDNNFFLSPVSLLDMSEGGAYVHNLFAGAIASTEEPGRQTPYHPAHATAVAGLSHVRGGDNRFYNNIFVGAGREEAAGRPSAGDRHRAARGRGLWVYDTREFPLQAAGNVYLDGARPYAREENPLVLPQFGPSVRLLQEGSGAELELTVPEELSKASSPRVTTALLGKTRIAELPYVNPDDSPVTVDKDFLGKPRDPDRSTPGPLESPGRGSLRIKLR